MATRWAEFREDGDIKTVVDCGQDGPHPLHKR
jgi:hypothetical protein